MPDFTFANPSGGKLALASTRGKPVLINLWATWCAPCIKELPTLEAVGKEGKLRVLAVSQFTLLADTSRGNRPSFSAAAAPEEAEPLYVRFCEAVASEGVQIERGVFGAAMRVELVNDGPVTIIL